jgi:hypothetical protein
LIEFKKKRLVKEIIEKNNELLEIADNEETKTRLNDINDYFRKKGFSFAG